MNSGAMIKDEASFDKYPWPDPGMGDYSIYEYIDNRLPGNMKAVACSYGGVLENAIDIVGFERLCLMTMMESELATRVFDQIGERLLKYYQIVSAFDSVGVCVVNDDWGFKTQTMFPPEMMRINVFPWIKKMVEAIHRNGKPVILHSCGYLKDIMDEIIDELQVDGKHSYEDIIYPVEDAYDWWGDRIAILGGIDMDFLTRRSPEDVRKRALHLLEKTADKGGFALGSGNSIAHYIPEENFLAMISAIHEF
jgi:uroporphyrinogen decarboxylase